MTPTSRTIALLASEGWTADPVERRITSRLTRDLFGIWDVLAVRGSETLAVQVTTGPNVSARLKKVAESQALPACREAGWRLEIHGWRQRHGEWVCRRVDVS